MFSGRKKLSPIAIIAIVFGVIVIVPILIVVGVYQLGQYNWNSMVAEGNKLVAIESLHISC